MLRSISITNFALIKELNVDLGEGMNVITGETGAGKSIVIDAVSLLLGERASKDSLRLGAEKMTVSALFDPPNVREDPQVGELLKSYGIAAEEELILMREMDKRGRTVSRINGIIVPVAVLKALGPHLMDIHGQHEHASLFKTQNHRIQLDAYAGQEAMALLDELGQLTAQLRKTAKTIRELEARGREDKRREEFDRYALDEIQKASLHPGEEESLEEEKKLLTSAERIFEETAASKELLTGSDYGETLGLLDSLSELEERIDSLTQIDKTFKAYLEPIRAAFAELESLSSELNTYIDSIDFSPERLEQIQSRLSQIDGLKKKYGDTVEDILSYANGIEERLDGLENADGRLDELKRGYIERRKVYNQNADRLHELRKKKAYEFKKDLEGELKDLAMEKAVVDIRIDRDDSLISSHGKDEVEFLISVNPGIPPKPLKKIASGGEISRIMLSLKCIFGERDHTDTMVFDEIDTGISGRTAQAVAEKISKLSDTHQVICITHLPQIAAMADKHFLVEKDSDEASVEVSFNELEDTRRIDEIARMIGGAKITSTTREHAEEMLDLSEHLKQKKR